MYNPLNIFKKKIDNADNLVHSSISYNGLDKVKYPEFNNKNILNKLLSTYSYVCAEINAKKIASLPLRLYARRSNRRSKFHNGKEIIHVPYKKITKKQYNYLSGNLYEKPLDSIRRKSSYGFDSVVEILDHPVLDLLRTVNPYSDEWDFIYSISMYEQMFGDSYVQIVGDKRPEELWIMPSQWTKIRVSDNSTFIEGYKYGVPGREVNFAPEDIIHFKFRNLKDLWYGQSKIEIAWNYICLLDENSIKRLANAKNLGIPPFFIIAKNATSKDVSLKRLEKRWNAKHQGSIKQGSLAILPGDIDVKTVDMPIIDQGVEDEPIIIAIANAFGVPVSKVIENKVRANSSQGNNDWLEGTISSYTKNIEERLNETLLPFYPNSSDLFLAFDNCIPTDKEFELKENIGYKNSGIKTANEVRESIGLEPIEGGDVLENKSSPAMPEPIPILNNSDDDNNKNINIELKNKMDNLIKDISNIDKQDKYKQQPITINLQNDIEVEEEIEEKENKKEGVSKITLKEDKEENILDKIVNNLKND